MAGETVLVVDDREDSRNLLREYILEPNDFIVIEAQNGQEALKFIERGGVDLIITDLVMPKMGGLELLESLRDQGRKIPAILMTFHGSEETAVKAFRLGARDYIMKPFAIEEMREAIERALTESRLRQERDKLTDTVLRVNEQLESRVQELRFLYGIGRSVVALKSLEQILNRIVEAAVYLTKAEEGALMLVDPASGELQLRAARGVGDKYAHNLQVQIDDSIAGQVVKTGRPIMTGGLNTQDSYEVSSGYYVKALLNVPLKEAENVIGVLTVNNKVASRAFTDRHLGLLMAMADYATIAIQNAHAYAQLTSDVNRAEQSSRDLEKLVSARTAELEKAHQKLLETEKLASLGYMATGVAKEMNEPIETVLQQLGQLDNRVEASSENFDLLASLKQEMLHCHKIVRDLVEFSGERGFQVQQINANDVVERAWKSYADQNDSLSKIEFVPGFDPHLPHISADPEQIEQALRYLIRHACQSMPDGGTLRATTRVVGQDVQIIISDTGRGIAQEDLRHIFDPFYESDQQTYGLDLSITHAIIHRHKGSIEVDSLPNQGTTCTIYLPISN